MRKEDGMNTDGEMRKLLRMRNETKKNASLPFCSERVRKGSDKVGALGT